MKKQIFLYFLFVLLLFCKGTEYLSAQNQADDFKNSFAFGREYFMLRSGNAKLILQSDKHGSDPGLIYMLFDAEAPCQTAKKEFSINYNSVKMCTESSLEIILGNTLFTSLPHNSETRWVFQDGIPRVEHIWWAGGIKVQEYFQAIEGENAFNRKIVLSGKNIAGNDTVRLRLNLPNGKYFSNNQSLIVLTRSSAIGICYTNQKNAEINAIKGYIESAPICINPNETITIESIFASKINISGFMESNNCDFEKLIEPKYLFPNETSTEYYLNAEYYNNINLEGAPVITRKDSLTSFYWDVNSPEKSIKNDSFSIRWSGKIKFPLKGKYTFALTADDKARLYIDDNLLIDCWDNSINITRTAEIESEGFHDIKIEYAELKGYAGIRFKWSTPNFITDQSKVENEIRDMFLSLNKYQVNLSDIYTNSKKYWEKVTSIKSDDQLIQELFDNAKYAMPGMISENGKMDAGIFEYGNQWVRDGSNYALGLIHSGHFEAAKSILKYILKDLVSDEGITIIAGGIDESDREEFDQMGELVHSLKAYVDWTGDESLLKEYRKKIILMIERPLSNIFRDSTGMVHNRREYWERTFDDAYELTYQVFMVQGLRDAADLSVLLGVPEKSDQWRKEANIFLNAMLKHPTMSLIENNCLIKRRNIDSKIADFVSGPGKGVLRDDPNSTESFHKLNPDASYALPILLRIIDPKSTLAKNSLDKLEELWNGRWNFGGYERYHSSSQIDQPGPWCFSTAFIARAQQDAGMYERSRRSLEWMLNIQGGKSGAWFEEIPIIRSQIPTSGIVPWASAEIETFTIRHWLGFYFSGKNLIIDPNLFPNDRNVKADLRFRDGRIKIEIDKKGTPKYALINGQKILPNKEGKIVIPDQVLKNNTIDIIYFTK